MLLARSSQDAVRVLPVVGIQQVDDGGLASRSST
jgi:hypothetical protein